MGLCVSNSGTTPEEKERLEALAKQDKLIGSVMSKEQHADQKTNKLLLLGAGESGKSTLFKQMITIYGKGVSQEDLRVALQPIQNNVIYCMAQLCRNVGNYGAVAPHNEEYAHFFASKTLSDDAPSHQAMTEKEAQGVASLWADPAIKLAWENRSDFQIYESAAYFFNKIDDVKNPEYQPTEQDYLLMRVRTTGIVENEFIIDGNVFRMFDVGGQRNERKKWIHCFENVTAVIFVAAISEYDQKLFEDETTNRLDEAIKLFDEICNSMWFKDTSLLLFLNKRDLFQEKITRVSLSNFFPEYNGPENDPIPAQQWIQDQFVQRNTNPSKVIYPYVTCATDTGNVRNVFTAVKDIIIRHSLRQAGLLS